MLGEIGAMKKKMSYLSKQINEQNAVALIQSLQYIPSLVHILEL